ncbi:MAG: type II toxin-antitoxin system RelE/ParE family toxin [Hoeflea sp.]|uniref:type II toxin-antitoxin system RelE/ParE family toxin n=1 Tax=Hoeflea sp. TaxID=1940281 RepID=UPI001DE7396C|nr:type II toxin-antitoxin system RelE/ParE family toxin [Hoeflea sp.]MBU4531033.1 type II toxin-antitoxin system RelE/ParE family toxin [Alphaproteobacteria bacterium]MBU4542808.1 type II toxin-antitoxin system RelE/ParE family toxin [Alphaproteobacteria bacterium]MBU4552620.1 type II toxin-antitoxin system RelE/ParE family toxin [Alphaproteobacteria bacterium]MBV1722925.1 type II toxin-antitoxin system RelE/ParE family toxin [Hoeflea sp.]MBV1762836.1 type II toxin-antitoxin system RelE/ParE 
MNIRRHPIFDRWLRALRDRRAVSKILLRIERISDGNFGDHKGVGDGVQELRVDHGPGYRVYYVQRGSLVVVLLCGGDKSSQARDVATAKILAKELKDWPNDLH